MSILFAKTRFFGIVEDPAVLGAEIIGAAKISPGRTKVIDPKIRFEKGLGPTSIGFTCSPKQYDGDFNGYGNANCKKTSGTAQSFTFQGFEPESDHYGSVGSR
jgi:hypothetical protein